MNLASTLRLAPVKVRYSLFDPLAGGSAIGQNWSLLRQHSTYGGASDVSAYNSATEGGAVSRSYRIDEVHDSSNGRRTRSRVPPK